MDNTNKEIWKDVVGYEGFYKVSNMGNIKNIQTNHILKPFNKNGGYLQVRLYKNTVSKDISIHRIVLTTFKENKENKPQINHINGIKTDNRLENLEWVTQSENQKHAVKMGLHNWQGAVEKTRKVVFAKNILTGEILMFKSLSEAGRQLNINVSNICACCKGRILSIGGYQFSYGN